MREGSSLVECTVTSCPVVRDTDSVEEAMDWAVDYEEDSLPVLGQDGRVLGVITAQEVVDYLEHASKDVVGGWPASPTGRTGTRISGKPWPSA